MGYLTVVCQATLGVTFLVAVLGKVRGAGAYAEFRESLPALGVSPRAAAATVAAEAAAAVLVLVPATAVAGFAFATALLAAFTAVALRAARAAAAVSCRCFGAARRPLGRSHVLRNILLATVGVAGTAGGMSGEWPDSGAGLAVAAAAGATIAALLIRIDDLADLFGPPAPVGVRRHDS